ncbi:hypothetical protein Lalb_Chr11g0074821 [Lupinus albus]|uniref:Uncharacterized protein n=1 Tax=Lupinus albus TaxID=3870 RepID=A0A6A4PTV2_LUPAL|nr:hypothetical protein Lalb_Chr11g0074821 [Lupinus albus]
MQRSLPHCLHFHLDIYHQMSSCCRLYSHHLVAPLQLLQKDYHAGTGFRDISFVL